VSPLRTTAHVLGPRSGYLGPPGTFTETALEQALARQAGTVAVDGPGDDGVDGVDVQRVALPTVAAALDAVRSGDTTSAVVPLENSVEGGVNATLDALAGGPGNGGLVIVGEEIVPVRFVLATRSPRDLARVTRIATHAHAEAQCRGWLAAHLPDALIVPALSTAAAAAGLGGPDAGYEAAICAPAAVTRYGLTVLADDVGDRSGHTRFVVVARTGTIPAPTGADRTTLVAYLRHNRAGALLELLEQFAVRGVDLTRIESRPTGDGLGEYCFSIDLAGHVAEPRVAEALKGLRRLSRHTRFLGSYPRADRRPADVLDWTDEGSFADADAWLEGLLSPGDDPPHQGG
jgi:prephenate dehydratase